MNDSRQPRAPAPEIEAAAARWLVEQDRGFSPRQQDEFLQWLAASPAHRESFQRHQRMWSDFNALAEWRPAHSAEPNPDLLARRRRHPGRWLAPALLAAAALAVAFRWTPLADRAGSTPLEFEAAAYRQETLADGSIVDLNRGAHLVVQFTPAERRLLLIQGEARFAVAKNPARPFVVRAGGVDVRATGTAFNVRLAGTSVDVLVTEGSVAVSQPAAGAGTTTATGATTPPGTLARLSAGQLTSIPLVPAAPPPSVVAASDREIERLLDWMPRLLDFDSTPLASVVETFNGRNRTQLIIADDDLRSLPIVASVKSDNVQGFVRLLEATMGVHAERRSPDEIVLHPAR
jgi:transmembrane sensor